MYPAKTMLSSSSPSSSASNDSSSLTSLAYFLSFSLFSFAVLNAIKDSFTFGNSFLKYIALSLLSIFKTSEIITLNTIDFVLTVMFFQNKNIKIFCLFIKATYEEVVYRFIPYFIINITEHIISVVIFILFAILYVISHRDFQKMWKGYLLLHIKYFIYLYLFGILVPILLHFLRNYLIIIKKVKKPRFLFYII